MILNSVMIQAQKFNGHADSSIIQIPKLFKYKGYIIVKSTEGTMITKGNPYDNLFYEMVIPKKTQIEDLEKQLNMVRKITIPSDNLENKQVNISQFFRNWYRQYFVYKYNDDTLRLRIIYCRPKFISLFPRFKTEFLSPYIRKQYSSKKYLYFLELNVNPDLKILSINRFYRI